MSTDKKNFETKKPHARKLFASFMSFMNRLPGPLLYLVNLSLWLSGIALYLWLCWNAISLLNQLVS